MNIRNTIIAAAFTAFLVPGVFAQQTKLVQSSTAQMFVPGNFEEPVIPKGEFKLVEKLPGWQTSDSVFEIWSSGFMGVMAHEGNQFVELNANIDGTLYRESSEIVKGATIEFSFAHRGRNGIDSMNLTITDLGADNVIGGGNDTQLFVKKYTTGKSAWNVYDSTSEPKISALGNTVRFAYTAVDSTDGMGANKSEGNFLDAAHFGVNVVTEMRSRKRASVVGVPHNGKLIASKEIKFELPEDPAIEKTKQWGLLSKDETKANFVTVIRNMVLETIVMRDGKTYIRPTFETIQSPGEVGGPSESSDSILIRADSGADYKVVIDEISWYDHTEAVDLAPVQALLPDSRNSDGTEIEVPFAKNDEKYKVDQFSNVEPVKLGERIRVRGKDYIRVHVSPVSSNPVKRSLRVGKLIKWHLEITKSDRPRPKSTKPFAPAKEGIIDVRVPDSDKSAANVKSKDKRPKSVETGDKKTGKDAAPSAIAGIAATAAEADYLIITPDRFVEEIKPLALWKHQKGFKTYVATLSKVGTTEVAIKKYIDSAYENGSQTTFVLLVGDHEELPGVKQVGHPHHGANHVWVSDHPYSLMKGSGDSPCITIGRFPGDTKQEIKTMVTKTLSYDRSPPVGKWYRNVLIAGQYQDRNEVKQKQECRVVARMDFKRGNSPQVKKGMFGTVFKVDSDGDFLVKFDKLEKKVWSFKSKNELELKQPKLGFFGKKLGDNVSDRMFMETLNRVGDFLGPDFDFFEGKGDAFNQGFNVKTALEWDKSEPGIKYGGWKYPARIKAPKNVVPEYWRKLGTGGAAEISSAIKDGVSFVLHRDHGAPTGWGDPKFTASGVKKLVNKDRLPFVFSINCQTGWFDGRDAFCESWLRNPNGGAVGFTGAARVSWSGINDCFVIGFFDTFWDSYSDYDNNRVLNENSWRPAEAMVRAKAFVSAAYPKSKNGRMTLSLYNWFGDPELSLRTDSPVPLQISNKSPAPALVALKNASFTIAVTRNGSPCTGAQVAITMGAADHHVAKTDASGNAKFSFAPSSAGKMKVVATERNSIPAVTEIYVEKPLENAGSRFAGKYENVPPTNDWHYVTIEPVDNGNLIWKTKAGVSWTIEFRNENEIWFGKDCPYGEMKLEIKHDAAGNFTGLGVKEAFFRLLE